MKRSKLRKIIKESIKELLVEQPTYQPGMYRGVRLFDCSQQVTNPVHFGGLPQPVGQWGNGANMIHHWPTTPSGQPFGSGDCVYLTDTAGAPVDAITQNLFSNQPIMVCYQGNFYSMTGNYGWSNSYPCTTVHNETLVNAGNTGGPFFDPNGPSCANQNCGSTPPSTGVYHEWQGCPGAAGFSGVLYWGGANIAAGAPNANGWLIGVTVSGITGTGNAPSTQPWASHQNSEAFWQFLGSPSPGQVVGFDTGGSGHHCLEYVGTVTSGNHGSYGGGNNLTNITNHPDCNDCVNTPPSNVRSAYLMDCASTGNCYGDQNWGTNLGWYDITIGGNVPQPGDTAELPAGTWSHPFWSPGRKVYVVAVNPASGLPPSLGTLANQDFDPLPCTDCPCNCDPAIQNWPLAFQANYLGCNCSTQPQGDAIQACDCNYYNQHGTCAGSGAIYSTSYPITIGGNAPNVGDTFTKPLDPTVWAIDVLQNPVSTCASSVFASINCDMTPDSCAKPCPGGIIQVGSGHQYEGYCAECLANFTSPTGPSSPWPSITGPHCECCEEEVQPCKKCCCEMDPTGTKCIPGTEIFLSTTLNPCKCPAGMVEGCKPPISPWDVDDNDPMPVKPLSTDDPFSGAGGAPDFPSKPSPLQERFQKLANIKK